MLRLKCLRSTNKKLLDVIDTSKETVKALQDSTIQSVNALKARLEPYLLSLEAAKKRLDSVKKDIQSIQNSNTQGQLRITDYQQQKIKNPGNADVYDERIRLERTEKLDRDRSLAELRIDVQEEQQTIKVIKERIAIYQQGIKVENQANTASLASYEATIKANEKNYCSERKKKLP